MNASKKQKTDRPQRHIELAVSPAGIPVFFGLLRSGFSIDLSVGCSLEQMFCGQLGVAPDYLRDRAQTVFLNSSPVDDLASASVPDRAVISLSAAMPGLNGAVMRRGGPLAGMRHSISYTPDQACHRSSPGRITLKLFNMVAEELGPHFLTRGIVVESKTLAELLKRQPGSFRQRIKSAEIDGSPAEFDHLTRQDWPEPYVLLKVRSD